MMRTKHPVARPGIRLWASALAFASALAMAATAPAAAAPISFDEAWAITRAQDPRLAQQQALTDGARALLAEVEGRGGLSLNLNSFVGLAPAVEGGIYAGGAETCSGDCRLRDDGLGLEDGISPWFFLSAQLIKPLATFGKLENYRKAAEANVEVVAAGERVVAGAVYMQLATAWHGLLAARDGLHLLADVEGRLNDSLRLVNRSIESGSGPYRVSDRYALETAAGLLGRERARLHALEEIAAAGLRTLMALPAEAPLELADQRLTPVAWSEQSLEALIEQGVSQRPETVQAEAGLEAMAALVEARKAEARPNVYAGLVGQVSWSPQRDRLDNPYLIDPFNSAGLTPVLGLQCFLVHLDLTEQPGELLELRAPDLLLDRDRDGRGPGPFPGKLEQLADQFSI